MLEYGNVQKESLWHRTLLERIQKQIDLNHIAALKDIDWKQSDGIWKEWYPSYIKRHLEDYKRSHEVRSNTVVTDAAKAAGKAIDSVLKKEWQNPGKGKTVPRKKYTKGVFRRVTEDKNGNDK
jgi:hypothetical protein